MAWSAKLRCCCCSANIWFGGRIVALEQPELERVLVLSIVKGPLPRNTPAFDADEADDDLDELAPEEDYVAGAEPLHSELIVEAMERRGNVILVGDDNLILASLRHVTRRMSHRPVLPREPYELPPRQDKRDPRQATPEGMRALQSGAVTNLARAIVAAYRGMSPLAAREAVFRGVGDAAARLAPDLPWARLALAVRGLWNDDWQPCLVRDAEELHAFAPYLLTHLPNPDPADSISAVLETFYEAREQLTAHQQRRDALRRQILETRERLDFQCKALRGELKRAEDLDRLRWEGEMIYAFLHTLTPGQVQLDVEERTIALDPRRSPVEQAQERFRAYDKAKAALAGVPERLQTVEARLAGLDETLALLELAEGFEPIEDIAREAAEQGYIRPPSGRAAPKDPPPAAAAGRIKRWLHDLYRAQRQPERAGHIQDRRRRRPMAARARHTRRACDHQERRPRGARADAAGSRGAGGVFLAGTRRGRRRDRCFAPQPGAPHPQRAGWLGHLSRRANAAGGAARARGKRMRFRLPQVWTRIEDRG